WPWRTPRDEHSGCGARYFQVGLGNPAILFQWRRPGRALGDPGRHSCTLNPRRRRNEITERSRSFRLRRTGVRAAFAGESRGARVDHRVLAESLGRPVRIGRVRRPILSDRSFHLGRPTRNDEYRHVVHAPLFWRAVGGACGFALPGSISHLASTYLHKSAYLDLAAVG